MKNTILTSFAVCLLLSSCGTKKKEDKNLITNKNISHEKSRVAMSDKDIYDENVATFELEEEMNPLSAGMVRPSNDNSSTLERDANSGMKTAYFEFDQYDIRADQMPVLEYDLKKAKEMASKGKTVVVEGHACESAGSAVYNMMLSEKRAEEIKKYFVKHGVSEKCIKTVGRGSEMLVVPHGNRAQQAPNRRVEVYAYDHIA
ncbi:OmpA family protein [Candidatus Dependentiae bacterium]|nr:OmpA family protein [Candidatus Dependentiae bacterium]